MNEVKCLEWGLTHGKYAVSACYWSNKCAHNTSMNTLYLSVSTFFHTFFFLISDSFSKVLSTLQQKSCIPFMACQTLPDMHGLQYVWRSLKCISPSPLTGFLYVPQCSVLHLLSLLLCMRCSSHHDYFPSLGTHLVYLVLLLHSVQVLTLVQGPSWSPRLTFLLFPHCVTYLALFQYSANPTIPLWWSPHLLHSQTLEDKIISFISVPVEHSTASGIERYQINKYGPNEYCWMKVPKWCMSSCFA